MVNTSAAISSTRPPDTSGPAVWAPGEPTVEMSRMSSRRSQLDGTGDLAASRPDQEGVFRRDVGLGPPRKEVIGDPLGQCLPLFHGGRNARLGAVTCRDLKWLGMVAVRRRPQ